MSTELEVSPVDTAADTAARAALAKAAAGELLGPTDIAAIWHIKRSRFHTLNKSGAFDQFKVRPAIGPKCFSGVLVTKYLAGQPLYLPSFGRKQRA